MWNRQKEAAEAAERLRAAEEESTIRAEQEAARTVAAE
jgi:hypothetical protein